jgi:class 3 adenylate cyclase/predicted ATPase
MTFDDVLDAAIELLRKRKRLTYRALKRQFSLSDEMLEDLKHELIAGQRLVVDEGGEVLVWREAELPPVPASVPAPSAPPRETRPEPREAPPVAAPADSKPKPVSSDSAERRQLTVMFCDLVGSTALSGRLDPEDLRNLVRTYQAACDTAIQRFDGYVAQYLGDGILAYFGYPRAHEDEAERAIHAALELLAAVAAVSQQAERSYGSRLSVRIGIHTGLVVVGGMGTGAGRQQLALGEAPNVAARVQSLAEPDTVYISEVTYRLLHGRFETVDMGLHTLKGVPGPMRIHRIRFQRDAIGLGDVPSRSVVGRGLELSALRAAWTAVEQGEPRVFLISGEAGIGKSRLVRAVVDDIAPGALHFLFRCSPYHTDTAFYPLFEHLDRRLRLTREELPEQRVELLEAHLRDLELPLEQAMPLLAGVMALPLPPRYPPLGLSPQRQKQALMELLVTWLVKLCRSKSAILIFEDLHWMDASTLDLLAISFGRGGGAPVLYLMTCRPEFRAPWTHVPGFAELRLPRMGLSEVAAIVSQQTGGRSFAPEVLKLIAAKTDGIPLFVEEVTKLLVEKQLVQEVDGRFEPVGPLASLSVPSTLQDSLMARLDQLNVARDVAQLGAVIGREFSYELLRSIWAGDEALLEQSLRQLLEAEIVYEYVSPRRFVFKHALLQEVAYESLLRARRQGIHEAIADALELRFPEDLARQPQLVARHLSAAGLHARAVPHWRRAGERAVSQSAHQEAIGHYQHALEAVLAMPESTERVAQELSVQISLGVTLTAVRGYGAPEVRQAYARAQKLCLTIGQSEQHFATLYGLWRSCLLRAEYSPGLELGEQLLQLAGTHEPTAFKLTAHRSIGSILFYLGRFQHSLEQQSQILVAGDSAQQARADFAGYEVVDLLVATHSYSAWNKWMLGRFDEALAHSDEALRIARGIGHAFSRALALSFSAWLHQFRRDVARVKSCTEDALQVAKGLGLQMWIGWNHVLKGWATLQEGRAEEAVVLIRQGISEWRATGSELGVSYFLTMLAEAEGAAGNVEEGLKALAEAEDFIRGSGERFWLPEVRRLCALLREQQGALSVQVEQELLEARREAAQMGAPVLELRALLELYRRKRAPEHEELKQAARGLVDRLSSGAHELDLREARELLAS